MRLDRLQLKGITCFRQPIDLDFTSVPAGLIAIVGENGSGKTTLMEAFAGAVYGELPTRGAVAKYATEKDSYLDATVTFAGLGTFRARRNIDGVKGVQDALLERDGQKLNDGKVTTFKSVVEQVFPPLDTLLASALAVQTRRGSFATRDKGARKELFYALLGLHRYEAWATTARAAAALLNTRITDLTGRLEILRTTANDDLHQQLQDHAYALTADLAAAEDAKTRLRGQLAVIEEALVALRQHAAETAEALQARTALETTLAGLRSRSELYASLARSAETDLAESLRAVDARLHASLAQIQRETDALATDDLIDGDLQAALAQVDAELATTVAGLEQKIANNRALIERGPAIRAAVEAIAADRAEIEVLRGIRQDAVVARTPWVTSQDKAAPRIIELQGLIAERDRLLRAAGLLAGVPCGGVSPFDGCQFLRDAAAAKERASVLQEQGLEQDLQDSENVQRHRQQSISALDAEIASAEANIAACERRIAGLQVEAKAEADLTLAEERIDDRQRQIAEAHEAAVLRRAQLKDAAVAAKTTRAAAVQTLSNRRTEARQTATTERADLKRRHAEAAAQRQADMDAVARQMVALKDQLAEMVSAAAADAAARQAVETHEATHRQVTAELAAATTALAVVQENVQHLRRRQAEFAEAHATRMAIETSVRDLQGHLLDWQTLAAMFGREGLSVIEIDAAGPGVSDGANDLLQASFGGRFAVELITQDVKADGKGMKEVFELKVYDHERGGDARDLADLSGGEQVIVDSALRLAIAAWLNGRNERPIRTVWLDETTGALDPDNAQRYLAMLRRLHTRAGLWHLIFVSHNPAVSSQADVQIQVADGRAQFVYPPFAQPTTQEAA